VTRIARYAAVALILGLAVVLTLAFRRDPHDIKTGTVGKPAPAFALPSLADGSTVSLDQYKGKIVVLNFWASWCIPCKEENPALADAWERYRDSDVVIVGIVFQDSKDAARDYTARLGNTWTSVVDDDGQVSVTTAGSVIARTAGAVRTDGPPLTAEQLREMAEIAWAEDVIERDT